MKEGSRIGRELARADLLAVAREVLGSAAVLQDCELLKGGLFNTTYRMRADGQTVVLRAGPVNRHLLFNFEKDMMAAEPLLHQLLAGAGVPVPRVVKHLPAGQVISRECLVVEHVPSLPMNDPSLEGTDLDGVYREVGRAARRMHGITHARFGWLRPHSDWGLHDTWAGFLQAFAAEAAARAEENDLLERPLVEEFRRLFAEGTALFDEIITPCFTHTDLWQGNVLLKPQQAGEGYALAAIIDVDRAVFGDPDFEYVGPWMLNDTFAQGYGQSLAPATPAAARRRALYRLLLCVVNLHVVLIEYDDAEWYRRTKEETTALLEELRGGGA